VAGLCAYSSGFESGFTGIEDFQVADFILSDALCSPQISVDYQLTIPSYR